MKLILAILMLLTASTWADSINYSVYNLGSDTNPGYVNGLGTGLTDDGLLTLYSQNCPLQYNGGGPCYRTLDYTIDAWTIYATAPSMTYDNGTKCSPSDVIGFRIVSAVCNGNFTAFVASPDGISQTFLYLNSLTDSPLSGPIGLGLQVIEAPGFIALNSQGVVVVEGELWDNIFLAAPNGIDPSFPSSASQVPEPPTSSLLVPPTILGLGLLAAARCKQRRAV